MNVNDFVGIPYVEGGRTRDGYDCYGLVAAVYRAAYGIELPDWHAEAAGPQAASRAISAALRGEAHGGRAMRVKAPADFDIAVVGSTERPHHVGVFIFSGVLHAAKAFGSAWHPQARFETLYPNVEYFSWRP